MIGGQGLFRESLESLAGLIWQRVVVVILLLFALACMQGWVAAQGLDPAAL